MTAKPPPQLIRQRETPLPKVWTPEHVKRRYVEAIKTLNRVPVADRAPAGFGSTMPAHSHDFADRVGWHEGTSAERSLWDTLADGAGMAEAARREAARANRTRLGATAEQVAGLDQAIGWPGAYVAERGLRQSFIVWACGGRRAGDPETSKRRVGWKTWCRQRKLNRELFLRSVDRAARVIAAGLTADGKAVW